MTDGDKLYQDGYVAGDAFKPRDTHQDDWLRGYDEAQRSVAYKAGRLAALDGVNFINPFRSSHLVRAFERGLGNRQKN